jgi:hypothetical protein
MILHSNLLQASVCALQAQLQQPSLEGLPNVLLHRIMCIVWDTRPASEASFEVQLALSLQCLSRRFQQVLRAHPLQLHLDFSNTQLAERHLAWLALPAWKDRVTSLTLYDWLAPACEARSRNFLDPGLCTEDDVASPLLIALHANQRGSLRQLLGMPLRMGGVMEPLPDDVHRSSDEIMELQRMPRVNLRAFHLTHLGVIGGFADGIEFNMLPQTVVSLVYRAAYKEVNVWFSRPSAAAGALVQPPDLAGVRVYGGGPAVDLACSRAVDGWHVRIEGDKVMMDVSAGLHPHSLPRTIFAGTRVVRIDANDIQIFCMSRAGEMKLGLEALADSLCPPCLQSMEFISGSQYPGIHLNEDYNVPDGWQSVVRKMIEAYGSKFAFEVNHGSPKRAAWRRWPAPGTQEHDAACRLHIEAKSWAAA